MLFKRCMSALIVWTLDSQIVRQLTVSQPRKAWLTFSLIPHQRTFSGPKISRDYPTTHTDTHTHRILNGLVRSKSGPVLFK